MVGGAGADGNAVGPEADRGMRTIRDVAEARRAVTRHPDRREPEPGGRMDTSELELRMDGMAEEMLRLEREVESLREQLRALAALVSERLIGEGA